VLQTFSVAGRLPKVSNYMVHTSVRSTEYYSRVQGTGSPANTLPTARLTVRYRRIRSQTLKQATTSRSYFLQGFNIYI